MDLAVDYIFLLMIAHKRSANLRPYGVYQALLVRVIPKGAGHIAPHQHVMSLFGYSVLLDIAFDRSYLTVRER